MILNRKNRFGSKRLLAAFASMVFVGPAIAGPMEDLALANQMMAMLNGGELQKAEQSLSGFSDPNVKSIWAANLAVRFLQMGDLDATERQIQHLVDPNSVQIMTVNLVNASLTAKDCGRAQRLAERVTDPNIVNLLRINMRQRC
jgi:hypothetical protein